MDKTMLARIVSGIDIEGSRALQVDTLPNEDFAMLVAKKERTWLHGHYECGLGIRSDCNKLPLFCENCGAPMTDLLVLDDSNYSSVEDVLA